jgi:hypothetical protein
VVSGSVRSIRLVLLAALVLAGLPWGSSQAAPAPAGTAVLGILDSGVNPYHEVFRDRSAAAQRHPSTRFPGYPKDAVALRLTLDAESYEDAVAADCERIWSTIEPGQLYWFPGTTVVGAMSIGDVPELRCPVDPVEPARILDRNGHGTMTASRAVGRTHGACRGCPVVVLQGFSVESLEWMRAQSRWLDAQSHSWGPVVPVWTPVDQPQPFGLGRFVNDPRFVRTVEAGAQAHLSFWASGNGIATRGGVLGHPTVLDPRLTPSVLSVGGHDSGRVITWAGLPPHLASDACSSWAAEHESLDGEGDTIGSGTSAATPYVAGGALSLLIEARRLLGDRSTGVDGTGPDAVVARGKARGIRTGPLADGRLTLGEWRRLLLATATTRPEASPDDGPPCVQEGLAAYSATPVQWSQVPPSFPEHLLLGYGVVDPPALALGRAVLKGAAPLPDRTPTDEYFARDAQLRGTAHGVFRGGG